MPDPEWLEEAIEEYKRKLNHVRLRNVYRELIPKITDKTASSLTQNTHVINKIKPLLDAEGVLPELRVSYYNYGLALDKSQRTFAFMVDRIREHKILRDKWEGRGLNPDLLDKIDARLIFNRIP